MDQKPWYQSKVNALAVITFLLGALPFVQELLSKDNADPQQLVSNILVAVIGILTFVARTWFTSSTLTK